MELKTLRFCIDCKMWLLSDKFKKKQITCKQCEQILASLRNATDELRDALDKGRSFLRDNTE